MERKYNIILKTPFRNSFKKLDKQNQKIIMKKIKSLYYNPKQVGKPLTGTLTGLWSLRINKYRVIYEINDNQLIVYVLDVGHRKNIYK